MEKQAILDQEDFKDLQEFQEELKGEQDLLDFQDPKEILEYQVSSNNVHVFN